MQGRNFVLRLIIIGLIGILSCIRNLQDSNLEFRQEQEFVRVDGGIKELTDKELYRIKRMGEQKSRNYIFHSERPGVTYILPEVRSVRKMIIFVKGKVLNCEIYIHQGQGQHQCIKSIKTPVVGRLEVNQPFQTDAIRICWSWGGELCSVEKIELYGLR